MREEDLNLKTKWFDEIKKINIEDQLIDLKEDRLEALFKVNFRNWIYVDAFYNFRMYTGPVIFQMIEKYLENGQSFLEEDNDSFNYSFLCFQQDELEAISIFLKDETKNSNLIEKATLYADYLKENKTRFEDIDILLTKMGEDETYPSLLALAKTKIKSAIVDIPKLDKEQILLFESLDRIYRLMLLNPNNHHKRKGYIENLPRWFDFEGNKNPFLLREFPKEKETYLKILKTWLIDQIETRKKMFDWDVLPPEYQYVQDYAESLLPEIVKTSAKPKIVPSSSPTVNPQIDYPKHIFADEKAFQIFSLLMKHFKTHATISFVFRTMAEKEKPSLILVNDTPFRAWFNEQQYEIQLESYTKTYENSKNDDRIAVYAIAKEVAMNK
ncbi:MAG: hypothetical protein GZ086_01590 [Gelidibacter sp.]|nr:hypothetical protein [Gelidibacter sp.]